MTNGSHADRSKEQELLNYDTHAKVYEQVTAFQGQITTTINLYLLASGGIWAFALGVSGRLDGNVATAALVLHVLISLAAAAICFGLAQTVEQRLDFLKMLGDEFWPTIEKMGGDLMDKIGRWGVRRQITVWPLVPVAGFAASLILIGFVKNEAAARVGVCADRLRVVEHASTPLDLNRAIFLFNDANCDSAKVA